METKNVILVTAIATVFLIAAVGSASAAPCPAPGGTGITSSCELTQNYTVSAGQNGYIIGANNVVIDGKGYKITGDVANATCTGDQSNPCVTHSGIVNNGIWANVVVKDLEIEEFCTGVVVGTFGVTVENMTVTKCLIHDCGRTSQSVTHGIHVAGANNCTFCQNEIYNINGSGSGCGAGGNGIFMHGVVDQEDGVGGDYNNITCSYLHDNKKSGFFMKFMCMHCNISYNHATGNGEGGIVPKCKKSNFNTITYNNVSGNTLYGIQTCGNDNIIKYNTANDNQYGIFIGASADMGGHGMNNDIINNSACNNSVMDVQIAQNVQGYTNTVDDMTCDNGNNNTYCDDWSSNNLISVYFDFDNDGNYSKDPVNCLCNILCRGRGTYACCNPGLFNGTEPDGHAQMLNSSDIVWLTPGEDNQDCGEKALPDLVIKDKSEAWINATYYNVSYKVCNDGPVEAGASTACIYINGVHQAGKDQNIGTVAAYTCIEKTVGDFEFTAPPNTYNITVCADNGGAVEESNEDNNCLTNWISPFKKTIKVKPRNTTVQPQDQFEIDIFVDVPEGNDVYGIQYKLKYNTSVVRAETQVKGPFFGDTTIVGINKIDHTAGVVEYAETLMGTDCINGPANGTVATIQFTAIGAAGDESYLNIYDVMFIDCDKKENTDFEVENGTAKIYDNQAPEIDCAVSKHEKNNAAKKYACNALLCVNVTDPDTLKGYNIAYVRWDFGDGQYGTSEGGLPCNTSAGECCFCKKHAYISWNYNASGRNLNGHTVYYDPFNASVTATDDGCPELTDTEYFDVWVFIAGDANGDGKVNIMDLVWVGKHFGDSCDGPDKDTCCGNKWSENQKSGADLNNDCKINIADAVLVGANWGHTAW